MSIGQELTAGAVAMRDRRMLCVPRGHRLMDCGPVEFEDLAGETLLRVASTSEMRSWVVHHFPLATNSGALISAGPRVRTVREAVAAVSAGQGLFFLSERAAHYYGTPDLEFVPTGLPDIRSALVWRSDNDDEFVVALEAALQRTSEESPASILPVPSGTAREQVGPI